MANDSNRQPLASEEEMLDKKTRDQDSGDEQHDWEEVDETTLPGEYTRERDNSDIDAKAAEAIPTDYGRRIRAGLLVLLVTFVGFGGWAALAPLDGAAVAPGTVVVDSQNRVVQHFEGGIVSEIHVNEGETVEEGQPLVVLSDTRARSELDIVTSQYDEALGREARLRAERVGAEKIQFPQELLNRRDQSSVQNIIEGQSALFESRREGFNGRLQIFEQRLGALSEQIQGLQSVNSNLNARIDSYQAELANWQELFEQELADRTRINEMERQLYRLRGELSGNQSQVAELRIRQGETRSEMLVARQEYAEQVAQNLRETQQTLADLRARRTALTDTLERTTIVSPASGTVVGMKVHTVGGIVKPGDTLLEVVPVGQQFTIDARVQPQDIDRVEVGQMADLRLSAFNQQTANLLEGEVIRLSADAFQDEQNGERYYQARVQLTTQGEQSMREQDMYLMPGMPAEVMIRTGERTMLEYLVDPISRMVSRAFLEE